MKRAVRAARPRRTASGRSSIGVSILAGGLSTRLGRDKAALRLRGKSLLQWVRQTALEAGYAVRVIRKDLLARCGPLGGIHAALATSEAESELFLACDMPFIQTRWLQKLARLSRSADVAVFSERRGVVGFPFLLPRSALAVVECEIAAGRYTLQRLAEVLGAERIPVPAAYEAQFLNINTAADWARARQLVKGTRNYRFVNLVAPWKFG